MKKVTLESRGGADAWTYHFTGAACISAEILQESEAILQASRRATSSDIYPRTKGAMRRRYRVTLYEGTYRGDIENAKASDSRCKDDDDDDDDDAFLIRSKRRGDRSNVIFFDYW